MSRQVCDPNRHLLFVRGELSADAERDLTEHLDECESCGRALEHQVAEASAWREASELLGSDSAFPATAAGLDRDEHRSSQIEQVLSQLDPTDDPESLGRIGGYEITGVVGSGAMGVVLKARDGSLDRIVAVKVMAPHLAASGSARQRFAREAKAAAAVLHPNVIAIHGVSNDQALPYLVMPYVRGESLQNRIDVEGSMPVVDILRIGSQVAAGLAAAHEQGLVHRDIKPANILLEQGVERVTITDFGLARAVDDASMTRSGVIAGTPQYMSPEQARGEVIDARSDLFSLGSLLYAMCTGHSPFRAETSYGVLHRITHDLPRPIRESNPNAPQWLEQIVMNLLSRSPDDRFDSAKQVGELLEDCLAHVQQPTTAPLPESLAAQLSQRTGRSPWLKWVAAAAIAILMFAGVVILLDSRKGTIRIETNSKANIAINIRRGEKVVEELTVSQDGATARLKAGDYIIEVDGDDTNFTIRNNQVTLNRGDTWLVRVSEKNVDERPRSDPATIINAYREWDKEESVAQAPDAPNLSLAKAVQQFNREFTDKFNKSRHADQPPLTEDEVVACVAWLLHNDEPLDSKLRPGLRTVVEQRHLAADWKLVGGEVTLFDNGAQTKLWSINLEIGDKERVIPIRQTAVSPPERFRKPAEKPTDNKAIPLQAAINEFNASHNKIDGVRQSPLTMDEVLAAIANWRQKRNAAPVDNATFENLQRIARTHHLPGDAYLQVISHFETPSGAYSIWSVSLVMPQVNKPGWTYAFQIRKQFIGINTELASQIHWGKPGENGIQAGFRLVPAQPTYRLGQIVDVEFLFRSVYGKAPVSLPNAFTYQRARVRRSRGEKTYEVIDQQEKLIGGWFRTQVFEAPIVRKGQRLAFTDDPQSVFESRVGAKLIVKPDVPLSLSFVVANPADGAKDQSLETGEANFKIVTGK